MGIGLVGWGISRGGSGFSAAALRRMSRASGLLLLVVAVVVGVRLVELLAHGHKPVG